MWFYCQEIKREDDCYNPEVTRQGFGRSPGLMGRFPDRPAVSLREASMASTKELSESDGPRPPEPEQPDLKTDTSQAESSRAQNSDKTALSPYLQRICAIIARNPSELWNEYGEATRYVKQFAELEWDKKIQWNTAGDAVELRHKRDELIQIICREYPEVAEKLELQSQASPAPNDEGTAKSVASKASNKQKPLTDREQRIWAVIRKGSTGSQYCRELGNARIAPLRSGVWKDCPRTYISAYQQGQPWRHRIQDEKSKIRRKAELAGLANE